MTQDDRAERSMWHTRLGIAAHDIGCPDGVDMICVSSEVEKLMRAAAAMVDADGHPDVHHRDGVEAMEDFIDRIRTLKPWRPTGT